MDSVFHIIRYGTHADQKYLDQKNIMKTYTTVAFNGNMIAHSPSAIASFLLKLKLNDRSKGFFIDPITHAFQHDPRLLMTPPKNDRGKKMYNIRTWSFDPGKIKKSVAEMLSDYGGTIADVLYNKKRAVIPEDFDEDALSDLSQRVISYQKMILTNELKKADVLTYLNFAETYDSKFTLTRLEPDFLIAPYFFLETDLKWLDTNIRLLECSQFIEKETPITAQIVLSKELIRQPLLLNEIASKYMKIHPAQVMVWIDDFNEHEVDAEMLQGYLWFLKQFHDAKIPVINLYGGYFSELLTKFGYLNGVGHALEYGESRKVVPVGGGLPTNKYYFFDLHLRIDYKVASKVLFDLGFFDEETSENARFVRYQREICPCPVCKELLHSSMNNFSHFESTRIATITKSNGTTLRRTYAQIETKEACILHYQYSKYREFKEIERYSKSTLLSRLCDVYNKFNPLLEYIPLQYLPIWAALLRKQ